jgi:predicted DNA-binding transcriptional regulator AlpA
MAVDRLVREAERLHITGVPRTSWWDLERQGLAPERRLVRPNSNSVGWLESELAEFVTSRPVGRGRVPEGAMRARGVVGRPPQATTQIKR